MFLLWAVAGVLASAAAGLILLRAARAAALDGDGDPAAGLYRRQLAEIDDLADRGLLAEGERKSAHAEAGRRLLAATDAPPAPWAPSPQDRPVALLAAAAAPALALGLYLWLGSPGLPDQPFAARLAAWRSSDPATLSGPEIAAVLRQATRERPTEAEGFRLLGLAEGASERPVAAVWALRRAAALEPNRGDIWRLLGEAEIFEAGGKVDADAQVAFRRLLALEPGDPAARYFLASAKADEGRAAEAAADLRALLADLPAKDPRRGDVRAAIDRFEGRPQPAADPDQLVAIRGMVAGLAARLKTEPDDAEGWVRLVRAYAVLGDSNSRDAAYTSARARYAASPDLVRRLDEAARAEPLK